MGMQIFLTVVLFAIAIVCFVTSHRTNKRKGHTD
jgi:hypothetical protein